MLRFLMVYFFLINIVTLITFGIDKRLAQQKRNRVQESSLILLSALGGAAGGLAAMYLFRHKTKHAKFFLGLPALLLIHLMIAFLIIF
ncbi:MAG: DUF1294 domain-containing protein [Bacteroidales bacterium]|nr:DUF1294 domain-containing protein [Bacteroidales bacterium]